MRPRRLFFFFFNDTATTEIYTLSLHDALPICRDDRGEPILLIVEPLFDQRRITAWIRVVFSLTQVQHEVWSSIARLLVLTLALVAVGIIAVRLILRHMTGLLHRISVQLQGAMAPLEGLTIPHRVEIGRAHVELQSRLHLVCRLLLEKKKKKH